MGVTVGGELREVANVDGLQKERRKARMGKRICIRRSSSDEVESIERTVGSWI